MLHIGFARHLAKINLKDRATISGDGVAYRLADGSGHVGLDAAQWRAMNAVFDAESGKVLRTAKRWMIGLFPGIFVYGMTLAHVLPFGGITILAGIFLGPPAIYFWQSSRINRIALTLEKELAGRPKVAAPPRPRWRVPRWLEIAAAVLVGPHLAFEIVGSLYPEAYRNTPWLGTQLNWTSLVSISVLAAILYLRWRAGPPAQLSSVQSRPPEPPVSHTQPGPATFGRRVDPLARAHETSS